MSSRKRFAKHVYRDILFRQRFLCYCGCKTIILPGDAVEYDHELALHLGGEDHPDNLRALLAGHHRRVTARQARDRGKVARLQVKSRLKTSERSAKARAIQRMQRYRDMP